MSWAALFERASTFERTSTAVQSAREKLRQSEDGTWADRENGHEIVDDSSVTEGEAVRVVADADVLAEDLFVGGSARDALDHVRRHSWVELVSSDDLLVETQALIADLSTDELADDWYARMKNERVAVTQPAGDHPALASAYRGNAQHLLSNDGTLTGAGTNVTLQSRMNVSVRPPDAFARLFDPEPLYESLFEEPYPGPDRDPRE